MRIARLLWIPALALTGLACAPEYEQVDLAGRDGILRFNLVFDNEANVDLDLRVTTPNDIEIYWDAKEGDGGQLDLDCFCDYTDPNTGELKENCQDGPNENIYWDYGGEAPLGDYVVRVHYYGSCDPLSFDDQPSNYTLRVLQAGAVVEEHTGTLASTDDEDEYVFQQALSQ